MVRSKWIKSLLAALASTGLALGQVSERIITVTEAGKQPQKCRIIGTQTLSNGHQLLHAQDLATGEVMTIEETTEGSKVVATVIETAAPPVASARPGTAASAATPAAAMPPTLSVTEPGQGPRTVTVLRCWRTGEGSRAYQVQTTDTHETMTIVESAAPAPSPDGHAAPMVARIFHWGHGTTAPSGAPLPPSDSANAVATHAWPPAYSPTGSPPAPAPTSAQSGSWQTPGTGSKQPVTGSQKTTWQLPAASGSGYAKVPKAPIQVVQADPPGTSTGANAGEIGNTSGTPAPYNPSPSTAATTTPPAPQGTTNQKPKIQPAQPKDYHEEWGPVPGQPVKQSGQASSTSQGKNPPAPKVDPLLDPSQYSKPALDTKLAVPPDIQKAMNDGKLKGFDKTPVASQATTPTTPSITTLSGSPGGDIQLPAAGGITTPASKGADAIQPAGGQATSSPKYVPLPTPPASGTNQTAPAPGASKQQSKAGTGQRSQEAAREAVQEDEGGMLNAFTPAPRKKTETAGDPPNAFSAAPSSEDSTGGPSMPNGAPYGPPMAWHGGTPYASPNPALVQRAMQPSMPVGAAGSPAFPAQQSPYTAMRPMQYPAPPAPGMPMQPNYGVVPAAAWQQAPMAEPQLPSRGLLNTQQLMGMLHDSLYPSQREWAADQLGQLDWKTNGFVVDCLVKAAQEDPAPTVRAGSVRALTRMNVNLVPVAAALQALKTDKDPRVQTEVERALAKLAPSTPARGSEGVQPAKAVLPLP